MVLEKVFGVSLKSNELVQTHVMPVLNELTDMHPKKWLGHCSKSAPHNISGWLLKGTNRKNQSITADLM